METFRADFGPWALVTGASSGIGEEFARQLAARGLNLLLVARNGAALDRLATRLRLEHNVEAKTLSLDLARPEACSNLLDWIGDLDLGLVVSNGGAGHPAAFLERTEAEVQHSYELNALVHARLAHRMGARLRARPRAGLLFVAAMGAQHGIPYMAVDASAKAAVISLGRALNHEWINTGVHVTVLSPGPTETPVIAKLGFDATALPVRPMPVERCVLEGLDALVARKPHFVSGRLFRVMGSLLPPNAWTALNGSMLRRAAQVVARRSRNA